MSNLLEIFIKGILVVTFIGFASLWLYVEVVENGPLPNVWPLIISAVTILILIFSRESSEILRDFTALLPESIQGVVQTVFLSAFIIGIIITGFTVLTLLFYFGDDCSDFDCFIP